MNDGNDDHDGSDGKWSLIWNVYPRVHRNDHVLARRSAPPRLDVGPDLRWDANGPIDPLGSLRC